MKAAVRERYGPPRVLKIETVPTPTASPSQLLVRVRATTVNRTDCAILTGKPAIMRLLIGLRKPKNPTTGTDFAGEVQAVGDDVADFKPGDRVWGFHDEGLASHAQFLTIDQTGPVAHMPDSVSFATAVSGLEGAHYARNFIKRLDLEAGDKVLVNGATGAIGSALVQFLKHEKMYVTAVCNTKNIELIQSLGADKIYDYQKDDFTRDNDVYQAVLDAVGKSTFGACKNLMAPKATYISSELGPWGQNPFLALVTPLLRGRKVRFPIPTDTLGSMRYSKSLIEQGAFSPVIDREYQLEQISDAFEYVASGTKTGNVVINYDD